ncbi:hypothetical protein KCV07_g441, partial [Aureobasidium melanogenum]
MLDLRFSSRALRARPAANPPPALSPNTPSLELSTPNLSAALSCTHFSAAKQSSDRGGFDSGLNLLTQKLDRTRHIASSMHIKYGARHLGLLSLLVVEESHGDLMSVFRSRVSKSRGSTFLCLRGFADVPECTSFHALKLPPNCGRPGPVDDTRIMA